MSSSLQAPKLAMWQSPQSVMDNATVITEVCSAMGRLDRWIVKSDWKGYDTFDGLSSPYASILTIGRPLLRQIWQQAVRRFPVNLRPLLGIKPGRSSKAMGFFAQGYLRLYVTENDPEALEKVRFCMQWLMDHPSKGYQGYCWGNHFDYHARGGRIPPNCPTIVWTGLIGHSFMDAYEVLGEPDYLEVAKSACEFILKDLGWMEFEQGILFRYYPNCDSVVHNSSMIGASLLARVDGHRPNAHYAALADKAVQFTVNHQRADGAWYYGVGRKWAWIDSFHTAYVLEALDTFQRYSQSRAYERALQAGYRFFIETFFLADGTPRYYDFKTLPIDIQCASQAIQTLTNLRRLDERSVGLAIKVAQWTIRHMQDRSGYFHYRKYPLITNRTPTLHWGQATTLAALGLLYQYLRTGDTRLEASVRSPGAVRQACSS